MKLSGTRVSSRIHLLRSIVICCLVQWTSGASITLTSSVPTLFIEDSCGSETSFPSYSDAEYGTTAFPAGGGFEEVEPVLGRVIKQLYLDPFALSYICSTSAPNLVPASFEVLANQSAISDLCDTAASTLGTLPGSTQYAHSFTAESGGFADRTMNFLIQTFVPDPVRPYLQFWIHGYPGTVAEVSVRANFRNPNSTESQDGQAFAELELARFNVNFQANDTCVSSNNWRRFRVSMEPLLDVFENTEFTSQFLLDLSLNVVDTVVVLDNIEFVGPRLANDSLYSDRFVSIDAIKIPGLQSYLGGDILDTIFFILPVLCLTACLLLTVVNIFLTFPGPSKVFMLGWAFIGVAIAAYAVLEYFNFIEALADIDAQTQVSIAQYEQLRQQVNNRELRTKLEGEVPFGFARLALPKLNKSSIEKLFVLPGQVDSSACAKASTATCASSTEEFLDTLDSRENVTTSSLRLEATAALSQEHFLPILLASLILDIGSSAVQIFTIVLLPFLCDMDVRRAAARGNNGAKTVQRLARLVTLAGLALTLTLIGFVIFEPIRYEIDYLLLEATADVAIPVTVRPGLEKLDSGTGKFFIDSSSLGRVIRNPATIDDVGQEPLFLSFAEQRDEVYPSYRANTPDETCDWDGLESSLVELEYSLDCSNGIIPIVAESSVKPYFDFAYDRIIFNLVIIDICITVIDILLIPLEKLSSPINLDEARILNTKA